MPYAGWPSTWVLVIMCHLFHQDAHQTAEVGRLRQERHGLAAAGMTCHCCSATSESLIAMGQESPCVGSNQNLNMARLYQSGLDQQITPKGDTNYIELPYDIDNVKTYIMNACQNMRPRFVELECFVHTGTYYSIFIVSQWCKIGKRGSEHVIPCYLSYCSNMLKASLKSFRLLTDRSAKLNGSWSTGGWHDVELMQAQPSRLNQNSSKLAPRYVGTTERAARMLFWHCVDHGIKERPLLLENSSWWLLGLLKHSIASFRKSNRVAWKEVV